MRVLITGGAGFVGSRLALLLRRTTSADTDIKVLDNLRRRGSELNLPVFREQGIEFIHGDIRNAADFSALDGWNPDLFIEASAEPSVHAGINQDPHYLLDTNLYGTINCLEYAKKHSGFFVFLSTSRVYPIPDLLSIPLTEGEHRLNPESGWKTTGASEKGICEDFPLHNFRSLYGTSKLCSEYLIREYAQGSDLPAVINRCGVIAGPGQFGKVDQGVFTLWVARHHFRQTLSYTGFGGNGLQVRDLLHPDDLFRLIMSQTEQTSTLRGDVFNAGGGIQGSVSLLELTALCQEFTGQSVEISRVPETATVDIPWYITDHEKASQQFGWKPQYGSREIIADIARWIAQNERSLEAVFC